MRLRGSAQRWAVGISVFLFGGSLGAAFLFEHWDTGNPDLGERFASLLQAFAAVVAAFAVAALMRQIHLANRTLEAQLFDQTAGRMMLLNQMGVEHPRARATMMGEQPDDLKHRTAVLSEATVDYFDTELLRQDKFQDVLHELPDFRPWIVQSLRTHGGLRAFLELRRSWYSDELWCLYLRAGLHTDHEAEERRLVFVREDLPCTIEPGQRRAIPVPCVATRGDVVVHRHQDSERTASMIIGGPRETNRKQGKFVAEAIGISKERDDRLMPGTNLTKLFGTGRAADLGLQTAQLSRYHWCMLESDSTWLESLPERFTADPRRPPANL